MDLQAFDTDTTKADVIETIAANWVNTANPWADDEVSNTLTSSIFIGSGSTTNAIDLGTAEVAGTLAASAIGNGLTNAQVLNNITIDLATAGDIVRGNS